MKRLEEQIREDNEQMDGLSAKAIDDSPELAEVNGEIKDIKQHPWSMDRWGPLNGVILALSAAYLWKAYRSKHPIKVISSQGKDLLG